MLAENDRYGIYSEQIELAKAFRSPLALAEHFSNGEYHSARHIDVLNFEFLNLLDSPDVDILIVTMPVRHGKSLYLGKWAPTWYKLRYPYRNMIICSNTIKMARDNSRWVRDKVHELAPSAGLKGVDPMNSSTTEWKLDGPGMGGCIASGVSGSIVGFSANLLILDDFLKDAKSAYSESVRDAQWEWFTSVASTRLEPGGKLVLCCTRWHSEDLIGRIMTHREELGFRVRSINMQAIRESKEGKDPLGRKDGEALWPQRWPIEVLERRKRQAGHWWHSIYQGKPKSGGLNAWPEEYFYNLWCDEDEWPGHMGLSASAFDPSKGGKSKIGDYQASVYVGYSGGKFYVDAELDRRALTQMIRAYVAFNKERKPAVAAIEGNSFQELLKDDYEQACEDVGYHADPPLMISNTINKNLRIERLGKFFDAGMIRFRRTAGCELLVRQLKEFPNGKYDDGPDALEQAIRALCLAFADLAGLYETVESEI